MAHHGIVDQDIDAAECIGRKSDQIGNALGLGEIGTVEANVDVVFARELAAHSLGVNGRSNPIENDPAPFRGQSAGNRVAQSRGGAGYERTFTAHETLPQLRGSASSRTTQPSRPGLAAG